MGKRLEMLDPCAAGGADCDLSAPASRVIVFMPFL
jgi:hypothetical protein